MQQLDYLENYVVKVQPVMEEIKDTELNLLKNNLLIIRSCLLPLLENKEVRMIGYILENARKQLEILYPKFAIFKNAGIFLDNLNKILDNLLNLTDSRDYNKGLSDVGKNFPIIKISHFNLVTGDEDKETYRKILIFSLYIVTSFLAHNWPTEMKEKGIKIDEKLKREYHIFKDKLL